MGDSGSLSPDKKKSLVEKAPEDHLAEQRKVSTVFVEIVGYRYVIFFPWKIFEVNILCHFFS